MPSALTALDQEAARWRALHERGLSPRDQARFNTWLSSPDHAQAFAATDRAWRELDRLPGTPHGDRLDAELDLLDALPSRRSRSRLWLAAGALAAALALGYFSWYRPMHFSGEWHTAVGEFADITLPDGSSIRLNTDSTLQVNFSPDSRSLHLSSGEAYFTVAPVPSRPFTVAASGIDVRAIGTAFGVRLKSSSLEVTVTEGKVQVNPAKSSPSPDLVQAQYVAAGERAIVPLGPSVTPAAPQQPAFAAAEVASVPPAEIDRALSWREKRLVFVSAPLSDIVAEFNRYTPRKLVIADPDLAARPFGGTFDPADPGTLVELLSTSYGVTTTERPGEIILHAPRAEK